MLLLVLVALGAAQPYVVDKFDVHLKLEANGSMQVTERLGVTFNESKHGIFRDTRSPSALARRSAPASSGRLQESPTRFPARSPIQIKKANHHS